MRHEAREVDNKNDNRNLSKKAVITVKSQACYRTENFDFPTGSTFWEKMGGCSFSYWRKLESLFLSQACNVTIIANYKKVLSIR